MKRSRPELYTKVLAAEKELSKVWGNVFRMNRNSGVAYWYMELRLEWARLECARPAMMDGSQLFEHGQRLHTFIVLISQLEDVVLTYNGEEKAWEIMLDAAEDLGLVLDDQCQC